MLIDREVEIPRCVSLVARDGEHVKLRCPSGVVLVISCYSDQVCLGGYDARRGYVDVEIVPAVVPGVWCAQAVRPAAPGAHLGALACDAVRALNADVLERPEPAEWQTPACSCGELSCFGACGQDTEPEVQP